MDTLPKNPALIPLEVLIGKWSVTMRHIAIPQPLTWQDTFGWLDNAFIIWHWRGKNEVPKATSIINRKREKQNNKYIMFYYDVRGVSRIFEMSYENSIWKFWREDHDFYQRFEGKISEDKQTIIGKGEISHDGGKSWKHDFDISYTRVDK